MEVKHDLGQLRLKTMLPEAEDEAEADAEASRPVPDDAAFDDLVADAEGANAPDGLGAATPGQPRQPGRPAGPEVEEDMGDDELHELLAAEVEAEAAGPSGGGGEGGGGEVGAAAMEEDDLDPDELHDLLGATQFAPTPAA